MIYTASWFQPENHHGDLVKISRGCPGSVGYEFCWEMFIPNKKLFIDWKERKINEKQYTDRYREQLRDRLPDIGRWLRELDPQEDYTMCCYEKPGQFCHRNLAIKFVEKYRPDCYGGMDLPN